MSKKTLGLVFGVLLLIIAILIVVIIYMASLNGTPVGNTTTPTPSVTDTTTPTVTVSATTAVVATAGPTSTPGPTAVPYADWKTFSKTLYYLPDGTTPFTFSGKIPANASVTANGSNPQEFQIKANGFEMTVQLSPGGEILSYTSIKAMPAHPSFDEIWRVRYGDINSIAYYVSGPMTRTGTCSYLGEETSAPCGSDVISFNGSAAISLSCNANITVRNSTCDPIVNFMRVKEGV